MRVLVLTSEPITVDEVWQAVGQRDVRDLEVMVLAPALNESAVRFWMADADEAIARAEKVCRQTARELEASEVEAQALTGESDPLQAIQDALQVFAADRIFVFRHPDDQQRYREDFDLEEARERFGLPVDDAILPAA